MAKLENPEARRGKTAFTEATMAKMKKFMEDESKIVKGRFRCYETPGYVGKITYKKYKTPSEMYAIGESGGVEPFDKWMKDGEIYEIPLFAARFLNGVDITAEAINGKTNFCAYPTHSFESRGDNLATCALDERGVPVPHQTNKTYTRRYGFESLEFGT